MRLPALALVLPAALFALSCAAGAQSVVLTPYVSGLSSPVDIQHAPGDAARLFVVEQGGRIRTVEDGTLLATPALNIATRVLTGSERGLLGLAFDPAWPDSAYIYVDYTRAGDGATVIARYTRAAGPGVTFDFNSERVLLVVAQPFSNHNAGAIAFGPEDGYLYVTLGDGGSGGDPNNHGQRLETLLGSILRLDVRGAGNPPDCGGPSARYTIPPGNPYVGSTLNACDEIFAHGMRNPWRMSFDPPTGTLWVADVGQGEWEEVDTVAIGRNYGWRIMEGAHCYNPPSGCSTAGLELPVWEYSSGTGSGNCSVTGGYVYRGTRIPDLAGKYVYGDYCSGRVWALDLSGPTPSNVLLADLSIGPTTFGVDLAGELYVTSSSAVLRIDPNTVAGEGGPASTALTLALAGPHPVARRTTLAMAAAAGGAARLALHDVLGREVALLFEGALRAGETREAALDAAALAPGVYVARLTTTAGARSLRVVVAR